MSTPKLTPSAVQLLSLMPKDGSTIHFHQLVTQCSVSIRVIPRSLRQLIITGYICHFGNTPGVSGHYALLNPETLERAAEPLTASQSKCSEALNWFVKRKYIDHVFQSFELQQRAYQLAITCRHLADQRDAVPLLGDTNTNYSEAIAHVCEALEGIIKADLILQRKTV